MQTFLIILSSSVAIAIGLLWLMAIISNFFDKREKEKESRFIGFKRTKVVFDTPDPNGSKTFSYKPVYSPKK
jgi:hypothetical protein